ncbi:MAG: DNA adenine methylase [Acidobacteria bacterium]|nr:DNA adenine methylase [Acidobacteriota bacterium]
MMPKTTIETVRPLLRWAGSKRKLLNEIVMCVPATFQRYYEPFLGSACLFLAIQPKRAVLGDFNGNLVNFYETIALHSREVDEQIQAMPKTPEFYYQIRSLPTEDVSQITLAARFLYLNRYCFNGIYRVNKTGRFNVPRGKQTGRIPTGAEIDKVGELIRSAEIRHTDFEDCVRTSKPVILFISILRMRLLLGQGRRIWLWGIWKR